MVCGSKKSDSARCGSNDASCIGNTFTFAHSEDVHTVITDDKLPQETRELFLRGGAELL